jgi:phage terminase small subunit
MEVTMKDDKLNLRQERFVQEYLLVPNAKQAAIKAGYSPIRAEVTGCELVRNRKVADAIAEARARAAERAEITKASQLCWLKGIQDTTLPDIVDWDGKELRVQEFANLTQAQRSAIKRLEVRRFEREDGVETVVEIEMKDSLEAALEIDRKTPVFTTDERA